MDFENLIKLVISKGLELQFIECSDPHSDDYFYCDGKTFRMYLYNGEKYIYESDRLQFGWSNCQEEYDNIVNFLNSLK